MSVPTWKITGGGKVDRMSEGEREDERGGEGGTFSHQPLHRWEKLKSLGWQVLYQHLV